MFRWDWCVQRPKQTAMLSRCREHELRPFGPSLKHRREIHVTALPKPTVMLPNFIAPTLNMHARKDVQLEVKTRCIFTAFYAQYILFDITRLNVAKTIDFSTKNSVHTKTKL